MTYKNDNNNPNQQKAHHPFVGNGYRTDIMREYVRRFNSAPPYDFQPSLQYKKSQPENKRSSSFGSFFGHSDYQSSNQSSQTQLTRSQSQSSAESRQRSIQSSQNSSLCSRRPDDNYDTQKSRPVYQYKRRTPKHQSNVWTYISTIVGVVIVISFLVDVKFQVDHETLLKQKQIQRCFNDYQQNKCDQPVQVLIDQCNKLAVCASKDPRSEVRLTVILSRILGTLFSSFFTSVGTLGLVLIVVIMFACFLKPKSYEQQHHVLKYE